MVSVTMVSPICLPYCLLGCNLFSKPSIELDICKCCCSCYLHNSLQDLCFWLLFRCKVLLFVSLTPLLEFLGYPVFLFCCFHSLCAVNKIFAWKKRRWQNWILHSELWITLENEQFSSLKANNIHHNMNLENINLPQQGNLNLHPKPRFRGCQNYSISNNLLVLRNMCKKVNGMNDWMPLTLANKKVDFDRSSCLNHQLQRKKKRQRHITSLP